MQNDDNPDQPEPLREYLIPYGEWYHYPVGFQLDLQQHISKSQSEKRRKHPAIVDISPSQWADLGRLLADYLAGRGLNDEVLDKDDCKQLQAIAGTARKLFSLIAKPFANANENENDPLKDIRVVWFLVEWFKDQRVDFVAFIEMLHALSELDPKKNFEHSSGWLDRKEISRRAKHQGFFRSHLTRAGLQKGVDEWWKQTTGLSTSFTDGEDTPYAIFLKKIYSNMKVSNIPGASATAVTKARREAQSEALGTTHEALLEKLRFTLGHLEKLP